MTLPQSWDTLLRCPFDRAPHRQTLEKALAAYAQGTVWPPQAQLFSAFFLTPPQAVRVVILGQDPYHGAGQANGLAFSVSEGTPLPPSLRNIFTELRDDLGVERSRGDLSDWATQGVLLLNTVLTVEDDRPNSHRDLGWQAFTDEVIAALAELPQPIAFVLWGAQAQKKLPLIQPRPAASQPDPDRSSAADAAPRPTRESPPRLVLQSPHPSPLSSYRGFFGSRPFSQINAFLTAHGEPQIRW